MGQFGIRTKGGVCLIGDQYHALIDVWDNPDCTGEPQRIVSGKSFRTEAEALRYYIAQVRPRLLEAHDEIAKQTGGSIERREIWERGQGSLEDYLR